MGDNLRIPLYYNSIYRWRQLFRNKWFPFKFGCESCISVSLTDETDTSVCFVVYVVFAIVNSQSLK